MRSYMNHNYLSLQIFADAKTDTETKLNTNVTSDSGLSAAMKTFYDKNLIDLAGPKLIHSQFALKRPIPQGNGKNIEWRQYAPLPEVSAPITEGVTPSGRKLSLSTITATVSQFGDYVSLSDVLQMTAIDDTVMIATDKLADQAAMLIDKIDRNTLNGGTHVIYPNGKTSRSALAATDKFNIDVIYDAVTQLKRVNAPTVVDNMYVCYIHPDVAKDLMRNQEWIEAHKYVNPDNIYKGYIGEMAGVKFFESTNAMIWKGGESDPTGLAVYGCVFHGKDAFATTEIEGGGLQHIVKQLGSSGAADPLNQRATVGWKLTKVSTRLINDYIVRVECCSSYSSKAAANS